MTWTVYLIRTITGEVGSRIDAVSGSWEITLNKTWTGSVTVKKNDLRKLGREWWAPDSGGVLFTFTDPYGVERPIIAGPIRGYPSETRTDLQLDFEDIRSIFDRRTVEQTLTYKNLALGTIAWELVLEAQRQKPGGDLPVVHGSPYETGTHQRTYEAWNLANNGFGKRLTELAGVINGPDVAFRPRWANSTKTRIEWVLVHGTNMNPCIAQSVVPDFDMTAPGAGVSSISMKSSAEHMAQRVWATGAGEGAGVARTYAQDLRALRAWVPFTETVISDTDQADTNKLYEKAAGELRTSQAMLDQVTFDIPANNRQNPLGTFHVGDAANVNLSGWLSIQDGLKSMRLMKMSGSLDNEVTLDFQEDEWA